LLRLFSVFKIESMSILSSLDPIVDYKSCALSAARSKLAYLEPDDLKKIWLNALGSDKRIEFYVFKDVLEEPKYYHDAETSASAYSWVQDKTLHIVFRGTEGAKDVKIDLDERRSYLFPGNPSIAVHAGFLRQFRALKGELNDTISKFGEQITCVQFSGHSLGGALATLAAGFFSPHIRSILGVRIVCHTIGSPRVGNKGFTVWFEGKVDESVRLLNFKDPVPLLPINGAFTHIVGGYEMNETGQVKRLVRDKPWYLRLLFLPFEIYYLHPIKNHACDLYIERLLKIADWSVDFSGSVA